MNGVLRLPEIVSERKLQQIRDVSVRQRRITDQVHCTTKRLVG